MIESPWRLASASIVSVALLLAAKPTLADGIDAAYRGRLGSETAGDADAAAPATDRPVDSAEPGEGDTPPPESPPATGDAPPAPPPESTPPKEKAPVEKVDLRPPPRMKDWIGIGYDGSLGGLQALSLKYWASRVGFQLLFGMRFEAFRESSSADNDDAGFGFGLLARVALKALQGDLVQLNVVGGAGLIFFRRPASSSGGTSFDFFAEVGIQPEVFLTRTFTFHGLVGFGMIVPGGDNTGEDSFVLNLGTTSNGIFGVLAGLGFTFYLVPKAK